MKEIKQQFYVFRNGALGASLRNALGASNPYDVIFGLMLPQIAEIARGQEKNAELARRLWDDRKVRESRLLACYLMPPEEVDAVEAERMFTDVQTNEEGDILAFRLLKWLPSAPALVEKYSQSDNPLLRYAAHTLSLKL